MDLGDIQLEWQLEVDGRIVDQGKLEDLDAAPGASEIIELPLNITDMLLIDL